MTFKWTICLPPFQSVADSIEVTHAGITLEFETGSIGEAHGIFSDNGTAIAETFGNLLRTRATEIEAPQGDQAPKERKPRGPNKPKPEAIAPAPLAIPGAEGQPATAYDDGIPESLRRTAAPAIAPPPAPPAPPPPTGILAGKITAELDKRVSTAADGGQALADWLATSGITVKGATYAEAVTVLRLQADEKLGPIAQALGVQ